MKNIVNFIIALSIISFSMLFFSCSDSERSLGIMKKTATVVISLNLPDRKTSSAATILDRIFNFFVRDAVAQAAPPVPIDSVLVRVTGPELSPIQNKFDATATLTLKVPAGNIRYFEVTAFVDPDDPSAILSFRGTAVANLPAGETVYVPVMMKLNETKLVIPDYGNQRIVVKNNIDDSTWTPITATTLTGYTGYLYPYDIDFDAIGRIYIANSSTPGIIRIDNINGDNRIEASPLLFYDAQYIRTLSVDRINNLVYFATLSNIFRSNLDGTDGEFLPTTTTFNTIRGIDVDNQGMVYITGTTTSPEDIIIRYNPQTRTELGSFRNTTLSTPWDVLVRGNFLYVANSAGASLFGNQILELTIDSTNNFSIKQSYGDQTSTESTERGMFYGARRFIAIRNDALIIIDNYNGYPTLQKIISMSDMSGSDWLTYGQHGASFYGPPYDGPGYFLFYSSC